MFTNGLNMGLPLWDWIEKTVHGMEMHWLSGKEKVPGAAVSKECMMCMEKHVLVYKWAKHEFATMRLNWKGSWNTLTLQERKSFRHSSQ